MQGRKAFDTVRGWYKRFERPISSLSLISGFVFDSLTLRRVDLFWDNVWVVVHLTIVTVAAVWLNLLKETDDEKRFWLVNVMQFFFGGILSTYLVFYFRSATLSVSWPFIVILAAAFIANESLKHRYARLSFQIALLFLAFYSFAIYLLPILLHEISTRVFLLSGAVSLVAIGCVMLIPAIFSRRHFAGWNGWRVVIAIVVVLVVMNGFYFLHLIPPLPLSLMDGDVYQTLVVNGPGQYTVQYEAQPAGGILDTLADFVRSDQTVHLVPGDPLYAYTAIFSPTALDTDIIHEWQYYDATQNKWITRGRITLPVTGGADGGWRTFSKEFDITAGPWRVNVLTPAGGIIGQLNFTVVTQSAEPQLTTQEII